MRPRLDLLDYTTTEMNSARAEEVGRIEVTTRSGVKIGLATRSQTRVQAVDRDRKTRGAIRVLRDQIIGPVQIVQQFRMLTLLRWSVNMFSLIAR